MNAPQAEESGAPRRRPSAARIAILAALLVAAVFGARETWSGYVEPVVRPKVRDYLAFARVERYTEELAFAADESGVEPEFLAAVMFVESSGKLGARSSKDALGLFQLTMTTGGWRAEKLGLPEPTEEDVLTDARLNIRLGANNLRWLLDTFDGNEERALVAYNTGTGRLARMVREKGSWEAWRAERAAAGDSQLLAYAAKVQAYRDAFVERGLFANNG